MFPMFTFSSSGVYELVETTPNCETLKVVPNLEQCGDAAAQLNITNITFKKWAQMSKVKRPAGCYLDLGVGNGKEGIYFNKIIDPERTDPMLNDNWDTLKTNKGTKRFAAICFKDVICKNQNIIV